MSAAPRDAVVVAANPASGRGKGAKLIPRVAGLLTQLNIPHEIEVSEGPEHLEVIARRAAESGAPIVAALGGDGSVGIVANGLVGTGSALAVLPSGTGDDFAVMLGCGKLDVAVRALARPRVSAIDVARITTEERQRHFVNIAGAGFDSEVNETANTMRGRLGPTGTYVAAVIKTLRKFRPVIFEATIDGELETLEAMLVALGNGRQYGGGMKVCPDASLTDGKLEICVVGAMSTAAFLRAFPRVFRGTHVSHPQVTMGRGARIELRADREVKVYADGERMGTLPASFEVIPGALRVVTGEEEGGP